MASNTGASDGPGNDNALRMVHEMLRTGLCRPCNLIFHSNSKLLLRSHGLSHRFSENGEEVEIGGNEISVRGGSHHSRPEHCLSAAQRGCPVCEVASMKVFTDLSKHERFDEDCFTTYMIQRPHAHNKWRHLKGDIWILSIWISNWSPQDDPLQTALPYDDRSLVCYALVPSKGAQLSTMAAKIAPPLELEELKKKPIRGGRTLNGESHEQLLGWIRECVTTHKKCRFSEEERKFAPLRLIDLTKLYS